MPIRVQAETGCYNPGVSILNSNTNETNTFAKSIIRYPAEVSGNNWWKQSYTQSQLEVLFTPRDLDTCVTQGQDYFFCIIDTTSAQVQSQLASSGTGGGGVGQVTRVAVPTCGIPQDIPENLIATQCRSKPTAVPVSSYSTPSPTPPGGSGGSGGSGTGGTTVTGGTGPEAVYGNISFGSYVRSSVITCSTQSINSETGTVGGEENPEFYVADTNCKYILIQYNSRSRKLTSGESLTFTVNEVVRVTTTGTWVGKAWTPTFNRTYANVTYTFTAEVVRDMPDINMAHVKVGTTNAKFQSEMTITGNNNLSFKVKAGRNIQTRAAIYGRWEFDQKQVYWIKQTTKPITKESDIQIKKTNYEVPGGSGINDSTVTDIDNATKRISTSASGSTTSQASLDSISQISKAPNVPSSTIENINTAVKGSDLTKKSNNSYDIDSSRDVTKAIKDSQSVSTSTTSYEHYVKGVETSSTKKLVHTNPVSGGQNSIDSKKSLSLIGVEVDVTQTNQSIAKESNFQQKTGIESSTFESISKANTETAKRTADILTNVHSSANTAITDINSQNESNPYNGGPGPSNNKVKEYGPVRSFDLLPKSTATEKIQPYRYDADARMNKTFSFSLQINLFATPCGPCYTVTTAGVSSTCSVRVATISSITLPFQKVFINNLTPEANRWSRITRNYQDNF